MKSEAYILAAFRSPVVPRNGAMKDVDIYSMGATVADACIVKSGINREDIEELILGNVLGPGGNPARSISLKLKLNKKVGGLTIDRQCASGLDSLILANALITSGHKKVTLAGGVESYSQRPKMFLQKNGEYSDTPVDQAPFTPWPDQDPDMATAADNLATKLDITRTEQDNWAVRSHRLARQNAKKLNPELAPIPSIDSSMDHYTRELTLNICERAKSICGSITNANTSVAADGAAFFIVAAKEFVQDRKLNGIRIGSSITIGDDPLLPGLATIPAINKVLKMEGIQIGQISSIELMEAFAAQALGCIRTLNLDPNKVNLKGGSLARGHPIGASGAILVVRLFHDLMAAGGYGLATIPSAGGIGSAVILEA